MVWCREMRSKRLEWFGVQRCGVRDWNGLRQRVTESGVRDWNGLGYRDAE